MWDSDGDREVQTPGLYSAGWSQALVIISFLSLRQRVGNKSGAIALGSRNDLQMRGDEGAEVDENFGHVDTIT